VCSSDLYKRHIPLLMGLFFMGGVGRLLSYYATGEPHTLFTILMLVELILPIAILALWVSIGLPKRDKSDLHNNR